MLEVRAERREFGRAIDLYALVRDDSGLSAGKPLTMERVEDGETVSQATMSLLMGSAQLLMDELWRCGLRPSEGAGSAGSLAATERHLKDMQAVAMGLLRKDGVQV